MKIKDLPLDIRPREKALKYGIDALSDVELLAIILGNGTKDCNVIQLATNILSDVGGLNGLMRTSFQLLQKINGVKVAKALAILSLITIYQRVDTLEDTYYELSIKQILEKYQKRLLIDKQEKVVLVILNRNKEIVKETIIALGTDSKVIFSTREIFKEIYIHNGYSFYLIHTHPNDNSFPSQSDIKETELLMNKSKRLGLCFLDHYVIGNDGYTSVVDFNKKG